MSESSRLTQILLDIIDRVKHRGLSTKVNWTNFSNGTPIPKAEFERKVANYGLPLRPGDMDIIWENIGVKGGAMGYSDFVRFINMDKIDANFGAEPPRAAPSRPAASDVPAAMRDSFDAPGGAADSGPRRPPSDFGAPRDDYSAPPKKTESLAAVLVRYKQQIGNALLDSDPTLSGFISATQFESILQRIAPVNPSDVARLAGTYDMDGSGVFNYFTLLSDLCNQTGPDPSLSGGGRRYPDEYDSYGAGGRMDDYGAPPPRDYGAPPPRDYGAPPPRDFGAPPPRDYGAPPPRDYGAPPPNDYGAPPPRDYGAPPPNDYGASMGGVSRVDEIVKEIAAKMDNVYDSSQTCFAKWRGYAKSIGPNEFVAGARRDFKIDVTPQEAEEIIRKFGGNMTLGNFMKMMGAGAEAVSAQRKQAQSTEMDDNQKTILHIARQAKTKSKDWRGVFRGSDSPERLVSGLRTCGIYVLLNDIRPCWNKYGKDGIERMVDEFMATL